MKTLIISMVGAVSIANGGGSLAGVGTEYTQIANNVQLVNQYRQQIDQYRTQIDQFRTQIEDLDLQKLANKIYSGSFNDTLSNISSIKDLASLDTVTNVINNVRNIDYYKGNVSLAGIKQTIENTNDAIMTRAQKSSIIATEKTNSIQAETTVLSDLQTASKNAEGQMQAAQIGNQIDTEIVGQLMKMRQEQAINEQLEAEEKALEAEVEAQKSAYRNDYNDRQEAFINTFILGDEGEIGVIPNVLNN